MSATTAKQLCSEFTSNLLKEIDRSLPRNSRVLMAVSGGPDSMALLHAWHQILPQRQDEIHVATYDHALRDESASDAQFVENWAREWGFPCHRERATVDFLALSDGSVEAAARKARYDFLQRLARENECVAIATGHHADDQVETIVHRLVRGTGIAGLRGMAPRRRLGPGLSLVRPLLHCRRDDIEAYIQASQIPYRVDASNAEARYTRNRIRRELLPWLRDEFNPRVDDALLNLASFSRLAAQGESLLLRRLAKRAIVREEPHSIVLDAKALTSAPALLATGLLKRLLESRSWPLQKVSRKGLIRALEVASPTGPKGCQLPGGIHVRRSTREPLQLLLTKSQTRENTPESKGNF